MSCISRAMRARSAAAPRRPSWSRSNSSRAAFSCRETSSALRWRTETPSTPAAVTSPVSPTHTFSGSDGDQRTAAMTAPIAATLAASAASVKPPSRVTQYRAIKTVTSASCGAASSHCARAMIAITPKHSIGLTRRSSSGAHRATQKTTASAFRRCWVRNPPTLTVATVKQIASSIASGWPALSWATRRTR